MNQNINLEIFCSSEILFYPSATADYKAALTPIICSSQLYKMENNQELKFIKCINQDIEREFYAAPWCDLILESDISLEQYAKYKTQFYYDKHQEEKLILRLKTLNFNKEVLISKERFLYKSFCGHKIHALNYFSELSLDNKMTYGGKSFLNNQCFEHPLNPDGLGYNYKNTAISELKLPRIESPLSPLKLEHYLLKKNQNWRNSPLPEFFDTIPIIHPDKKQTNPLIKKKQYLLEDELLTNNITNKGYQNTPYNLSLNQSFQSQQKSNYSMQISPPISKQKFILENFDIENPKFIIFLPSMRLLGKFSFNNNYIQSKARIQSIRFNYAEKEVEILWTSILSPIAFSQFPDDFKYNMEVIK